MATRGSCAIDTGRSERMPDAPTLGTHGNGQHADARRVGVVKLVHGARGTRYIGDRPERGAALDSDEHFCGRRASRHVSQLVAVVPQVVGAEDRGVGVDRERADAREVLGASLANLDGHALIVPEPSPPWPQSEERDRQPRTDGCSPGRRRSPARRSGTSASDLRGEHTDRSSWEHEHTGSGTSSLIWRVKWDDILTTTRRG